MHQISFSALLSVAQRADASLIAGNVMENQIVLEGKMRLDVMTLNVRLVDLTVLGRMYVCLQLGSVTEM